MMEHKVTGCEDCPLYDSASGEYGLWCRHPDRPIRILQYAGISGHWNFPEAVLPAEVFEQIRKENAKGESSFLKSHQEENGIHLYIEEKKIETDDNNDFKRITPNWCPLNNEPITIIKE